MQTKMGGMSDVSPFSGDWEEDFGKLEGPVLHPECYSEETSLLKRRYKTRRFNNSNAGGIVS